MVKTRTPKHKKILFHLEKDGDDYPPNDWESLWALKTPDGLYDVDNIPFFVRGISLGDRVSIRHENGELFFKEIKRFSDRSVLRVIVFEKEQVENLRQMMARWGCEWEGSHIEGLVAFDVPPNADFDQITTFLQRGEDDGLWEYEEASIRHDA